jgi:hypothetical protein
MRRISLASGACGDMECWMELRTLSHVGWRGWEPQLTRAHSLGTRCAIGRESEGYKGGGAIRVEQRYRANE